MTMSINDIQNDYYDRGWMAAWDAAEDRIDELEAENQRLKELLEEAAEAFESASDGGGVDFYGYAKGIREEL